MVGQAASSGCMANSTFSSILLRRGFTRHVNLLQRTPGQVHVGSKVLDRNSPYFSTIPSLILPGEELKDHKFCLDFLTQVTLESPSFRSMSKI